MTDDIIAVCCFAYLFLCAPRILCYVLYHYSVYVIVIHDCAAGRRDWFAYGYPAYDSRLPPSCERNFYGRRWSWGLSGPVLRQPSSTQGGEVYGNACGGLSGGPVLDWRRKAVTSVVSRTYASCDAQGWGKIITAAIMGLPGGS